MDRTRNEGARQHEQPPYKCCTKAFLAIPKPQPTDIYFSISPRIIFGDINYNVAYRHRASAQGRIIPKRRKPEANP